jgi:hypothetical protein
MAMREFECEWTTPQADVPVSSGSKFEAAVNEFVYETRNAGKLNREQLRIRFTEQIISMSENGERMELVKLLNKSLCNPSASPESKMEVIRTMMHLFESNTLAEERIAEFIEAILSRDILFGSFVLLREAAVEALSVMRDSNVLNRRRALEVCIVDLSKRLDNRTVLRDDRKISGTEAVLGYPDAEGWGSLETSLKALVALLQSIEPQMANESLPPLYSLIYACVRHTNRFAREQGQLCVAELIRLVTDQTVWRTNREDLIRSVRSGLEDNWSQVRYAALSGCRSLIRFAVRSSLWTSLYSNIVPPLLLNRHFVAEGVKRYAQETWRMMVGPQGGRELVRRELRNILTELVLSVESPNHSIREAALACMLEVLLRVPIQGFEDGTDKEHFGLILKVCLLGAQDDAWPVRELAAQCITAVFSGLIDDLDPSTCSVLYERLSDLFYITHPDIFNPMIPMREVAGQAVAALVSVEQRCSSSNGLLWDKSVEMLSRTIRMWEKQGHSSASHCDSSHENRPMYSCGTLVSNSAIRAAKHSLSDDCCSGGHIDLSSESQPWEVSDGAFRFYRALVCSRHIQSDQQSYLHRLCIPAITHYIEKHNAGEKVLFRTVFECLGDILTSNVMIEDDLLVDLTRVVTSLDGAHHLPVLSNVARLLRSRNR